MRDLFELVQEGGFATYPLLFLGAFGLVAALGLGLAGLGSRRWKLPLGCAVVLGALGGAVLALGGFGMAHGLHLTNAALTAASPDQVEAIRAEGTAEARSCLVLAFALAPWPLACAVLLAGVGVARRSGGSLVRSLGAAIAAGGTLAGGLLFDWHEAALREGERALASVAPEQRAALLAFMHGEAHRHAVHAAAAFLVCLAIATALFLKPAEARKPDLSAG